MGPQLLPGIEPIPLHQEAESQPLEVKSQLLDHQESQKSLDLQKIKIYKHLYWAQEKNY